MCLSVSRLFWVSSLAYPNLLGTKGYVVVHVKNVYKRSGVMYAERQRVYRPAVAESVEQ
jgi:hypothetical protein